MLFRIPIKVIRDNFESDLDSFSLIVLYKFKEIYKKNYDHG